MPGALSERHSLKQTKNKSLHFEEEEKNNNFVNTERHLLQTTNPLVSFLTYFSQNCNKFKWFKNLDMKSCLHVQLTFSQSQIQKGALNWLKNFRKMSQINEQDARKPLFHMHSNVLQERIKNKENKNRRKNEVKQMMRKCVSVWGAPKRYLTFILRGKWKW